MVAEFLYTYACTYFYTRFNEGCPASELNPSTRYTVRLPAAAVGPTFVLMNDNVQELSLDNFD